MRTVLQSIFFCALWMIFSTLIILVNNQVLHGGFNFPFCLSMMGSVTSSLVSYSVCIFRSKGISAEVTWQYYLTRVLPVGLFTALSLGTGNYAYLHLPVSIIQILKAFSPVATMIAMFIAKLEKPHGQLILSVVGIAVGTIVTSSDVWVNSLFGLSIMIFTSVCEATRLVMTQLLLDVKFDNMEGVFFMSTSSSFWLLLAFIIYEWRAFTHHASIRFLSENRGILSFACSLGFIVTSLSYSVIHRTSSLGFKLLATLKSVIVIVSSILLYGDHVTTKQALGYLISISCFFWYQRIKSGQMKPIPGMPNGTVKFPTSQSK